MMPERFLRPESIDVHDHPFHYFTADLASPRRELPALVEWLENEGHWNLVRTDFYQQYELSWKSGQLPPILQAFISSPALEAMRLETEKVFGVPFALRTEWTLHKLVSGQRIRIHNDLLGDGETYRVIVHLNRRWNFTQGGFLMLFDSQNPCDVHRILMPLNGSVVGFAISHDSNHAVSQVFDGERFSIVYSFHAATQS